MVKTKIEFFGKTIFNLLGLEIKWVHQKTCNAQNIIIKNPIEHNSLETLNNYYSNSKNIKKYLESNRILFYHEVINILCDKGIIFNKKSITDIGCGTGNLLQILSKKNDTANLVGFEYSTSAIKIAQETCPKANFFQFNIYEGNTQKFDVLFCTEVLEHLLYPDKAIKNILNMMNNNGVLLITVPNGRTDTYYGHINFWSFESWKVFIETNCKGFKYDIGLTKMDNNYAIIKLK